MCLSRLEDFDVETNIGYKFYYTYDSKMYCGLYNGLMAGQFTRWGRNTSPNKGPYNINEWIDDTLDADIGWKACTYRLGFHCYLDLGCGNTLFDNGIRWPKYKIEFADIIAKGYDEQNQKIVVVRKMKILEKV